MGVTSRLPGRGGQQELHRFDVASGVVYPGEGHGWQRLDHRLNFAARLERFMAENLR